MNAIQNKGNGDSSWCGSGGEGKDERKEKNGKMRERMTKWRKKMENDKEVRWGGVVTGSDWPIVTVVVVASMGMVREERKKKGRRERKLENKIKESKFHFFFVAEFYVYSTWI